MQGFQLIESIRQQRQGFQRKQERTTSAYLRLAGSFSSDGLSKGNAPLPYEAIINNRGVKGRQSLTSIASWRAASDRSDARRWDY